MTGRKPAGETWESRVDRQIREGQERGEFDDLPGSGKPLPGLHGGDDELWWARKKLKREKLSYLPPTLHVRRELEMVREQIARADSEEEVRRILAGINERIRDVNRTSLEGPPSTLMPLDEERTIDEWRERRTGETG